MKKGLVFGKFMPVHQGHIALIAFAAAQCDQLIVSMNCTPADSIAPEKRMEWLRALFGDRDDIELVQVWDDFSDDSLPLWEATRLWSDFIKQRFPDIDGFFCSEPYGEPLSHHLGLPCVWFDRERRQVPVSATLIRQHPARYWDFIPDVVKPYFVKKVCLFGPESVGKTTLAERLAGHYHTVFVHEVARDLITSNDLTLDDYVQIGHAQTDAVLKATESANRLLICDTDLITTELYSEHYLNEVPPVLYELEKQVVYDRYFLLNIDVPWVADGLRDLGHRREEMYQRFKTALEARGIAYIDVSGDWEQRWAKVTGEIDRLLA
ncbi:AAA family ATPase [Larkinella terrae]|uniref:AAA family ATPase n=1 Tax=Larkinella terrae TaxID=2025311 RepID=A0A7K0EUB6_9BACT|nr:AAA family ATPase [Larkinella terrae]MRS65166.1 AAA family ATPase [Larkinella terrae]